MKVYIETLGCPKNTVDSESMAAVLENGGNSLTDDPYGADALVVNTCAFIKDAKEESIGAIFDMAGIKKNSGQLLVVTGCLPQRYADELEYQFLLRGQAEIALLDNLDIIVDKADTAVEKRIQQTDKHKAADGIQPAVTDRVQQYARGRRDHDTDDEHDTAHCGSTLLILMPVGTLLQNRLAEFQPVQKGDQKFTYDGRYSEGHDRRAERP